MTSRKRKRKRTKRTIPPPGKQGGVGAGVVILPPVVFFAAFGVCVWLFVQPELIYHAFHRLIFSAPRFQTDWAFCRESLATVGGPLAYLYGFLSHCFYFPWAGTVVLTLVAVLLWLASRILLAQTRVYDPPVLCYLCAVFVLAGAASYHHGLLVALSVLAALAGLAAYVGVVGESRLRAGMLFAAAFAVMFYTAGSAAILFGLLVAFYELAVRRRVILAVAFAAATLGTYFISTACFELPIYFVQPMEQSVQTRHTLPRVQRLVLGSVYAMHLMGFVTIGYVALYQLVAGRAAPAGARRAEASSVPSRILRAGIRWTGALLPLALLPLTFHLCSVPAEKLDLLSSYYCSRAEWQKVIDLNRRRGQAEPYSVYLNHDLNRALYHTGQLGEVMFTFPQSFRALMLVVEKPADRMHPPATTIRRIDVMMELGHLAGAEQMAFDLLENSEGWALAVEKLAQIQLAKGQNETARIFLNELSKDLIHGPAARRLLHRLDEDPELTTYAPVQHLRSIANETDQTLLTLPADIFFGDLLRKNPQNRMAFEYMMAQYLLTNQVGKFLENLDRLEDVGYDAIPRHYDEALALLVVRGAPTRVLHGYRPGPDTVQEVVRFREICDRFGTGVTDEASRKVAYEATREALRDSFEHTFMFYIMFGVNREP